MSGKPKKRGGAKKKTPRVLRKEDLCAAHDQAMVEVFGKEHGVGSPKFSEPKIKIRRDYIPAAKLHQELRLAQLPLPGRPPEKLHALCVATMDLKLVTSAEKLWETKTWKGDEEQSLKIVKDELSRAMEKRDFDFLDILAKVWTGCGIADNPESFKSEDEETNLRRSQTRYEPDKETTVTVRRLLMPTNTPNAPKRVEVIRCIQGLQKRMRDEAYQRGELSCRAPTQGEILKSFKGGIERRDLRDMLKAMKLKELLSE